MQTVWRAQNGGTLMLAVYVLGVGAGLVAIVALIAALERAKEPLQLSQEWIRDHAPDRDEP
jgi:hypothetical protein